MNLKSTIFAILLGLAALGVPAVASAHPHPYRAYHRAIASARFQSMNHWGRQRFLSNHPYLANHRWLLNQRNGFRNAARNARWYRKHPWARNANGYQNAWGAPGYGYAQPAWQQQEPDGDDYNNSQMVCQGDGDADDCGSPGYGYGVPNYGYASPYYGNYYGGYGMSSMLPMLQQYIR